MKILLREYNGKRYVWETAKYNNYAFYVNGEQQHECNIVSVINDNRKNYIQCSCCGQTFRKGDRRFQLHKENAKNPTTCLSCPHMAAEKAVVVGKKYTIKPDWSCIEKLEREVRLVCTHTGWFSYDDISSSKAISGCKKRQCETATEIEIEDFFTRYRGAFDDIITIDRLIDEGYNARVGDRYDAKCEFIIEDDYTIGAVINNIGIVDGFFVWFDGDRYDLYYSKRYNELFIDCGQYEVWRPGFIDNETQNKIKKEIAKLYN